MGLKELKGLRSLQTLDLGGTKVTDAGLKELKELKSLRELRIDDIKVTDEGVADLRKALPKLAIHR
jgi:Leucine Rich repeat